MRIGAIFARGSCRALKWMLVLGALSVLGSAQAVAQAPEIEKAEYDSASSRFITVTTNVPVYLDEGTLQALAADFALSGGDITGSRGPIEVMKDLPTTSVPGSTTFSLRFASTIGTLRGTGTGGLMLEYTAGAGRTILRSGDTNSANAMVDTATPIPVMGPGDDTELTLQIGAAGAAFAQPLQVGTSFRAVELPVATGITDEAVTYSIRGLPPGLIIQAPENPAGVPAVARYLGVEGATSGQLAVDAAGDFVGMLPDNIGTYPVVYSATATVGGEVESDEASFIITLADTPEAVTKLDVATAGPSSLKVTWEEGSPNLGIHNNARIILYELHYRAAAATVWLPALLPESIAQSKAKIKSYTINPDYA